MNQINRAVVHTIIDEQANAQSAGSSIEGMCSRTTRIALEKNGYRYPQAGTALESHAIMEKDPGAYGWAAVPFETTATYLPPDLSLVYFSAGVSPDGHVGVYHEGVIWSDTNREWTAAWAARLIGVYVPA
jgi:hypothetical protein